MISCPCGSDVAFAECCEPAICGRRQPRTAEELMRSRYCAYARKEVDYIYRTVHPGQRKKADRGSIRAWADAALFRRLEILAAERGGPDDDTGMVEFIAYYQENGEDRQHHECAHFQRLEGQWYFDQRRSAAPRLKSTRPAVGRNDPCPCGSGKKYKKCCGRE